MGVAVMAGRLGAWAPCEDLGAAGAGGAVSVLRAMGGDRGCVDRRCRQVLQQGDGYAIRERRMLFVR